MFKKVLTYKSGQYVFNDKYDHDILNPLILESDILYKTIQELPILPSLAAQLEEQLMIRSIFGTAAIEGNPLKEEEVANILTKENSSKVSQAENEIKNLKKAYDYIASLEPSSSPYLLNEDQIKDIHSIVTKDIEHPYNQPGNYRNHLVKVGNIEHGGVHTPPKILEDIKTLIREYILWINDDEIINLNPMIRSALAHYYLGLIHPFGDGNGRTARLIEAMLLRRANIKYVPTMLSNYYYRHKDEYFIAFSNTIKTNNDNLTPFLNFVLIGVRESLNEIKKSVIYFIYKFTLKDFYAHLKDSKEISQRQYEILLILIEENVGINLKKLFNDPPFRTLYNKSSERTARRDLLKLYEMNLLTIDEDDNNYWINYTALG
jgi:Fic family protein